MSIRTLTCFLFSIILVQTVAGQRNCATLDHWDTILKKHSTAAQNRALIERQTQQYTSHPELRGETNILIPVVVNIVYNSTTENISEALILDQIRVLNEDFGHYNTDADGAWPQAAATGFQFQLANRAPDGTPSNGIRRKYTPYTGFSTYDDVKFAQSGGLDAWPTDQYLNLWVCNLDGDIMGYGQLPGGPKETDGVVIDFQYFGRRAHTKAPFDLGRTATHEVGHWLNLFHIWGDGDCTIDDLVADTPDSDQANNGCPQNAFSCGGKLMVQNFMDYTDDACMNLFTAGQAKRMQALFATGGFRNGFLRSTGIQLIAQLPNGTTCGDGLQNGDETGVDCGGSCTPCAEKAKCPVPIGINQVHSGSKVTLKWEALGTSSYLAEIRQLKPSVSKWAGVVTNNNNASVSGVRIGRTYEWRVRCICQTGDTSALASAIFVTRSSERRVEYALPVIYPNPSKGQFYFNPNTVEIPDQLLKIDASEQRENSVLPGSSFLQIKNMQGQLIKTISMPEGAAATTKVEVPGLPEGMYFIHWLDERNMPLSPVYKFIIN